MSLAGEYALLRLNSRHIECRGSADQVFSEVAEPKLSVSEVRNRVPAGPVPRMQRGLAGEETSVCQKSHESRPSCRNGWAVRGINSLIEESRCTNPRLGKHGEPRDLATAFPPRACPGASFAA